MIKKLLFFLLFLMAGTASSQDHLPPDLLLKKPSGLQLFAENYISTGHFERDLVISPNRDEIIYTLSNYARTERHLVIIKKEGTEWGSPQLISFSGPFQDIEPFYSQNGNRLFFASNRPLTYRPKSTDYNIWYSDRTKEGWGNPVALGAHINSEKDEFYPSLSENGNLYFTTSREEGLGEEDIYVSRFEAGEYQQPEVLGAEVNSEVYEFNAWISPKEDLLIFSSFGRKDSFGGGDLYYSKKDDQGNWGKARNMGAVLNSPRLDFCPFVDLEQGVLYFSSDRMLEEEKELNFEKFRLKMNKPGNGLGDIYYISLEEINLE